MEDPVCIFKPGEDTVNVACDLERVLKEDILDCKIAVISIAGRFRKGKSFLMNFFIK